MTTSPEYTQVDQQEQNRDDGLVAEEGEEGVPVIFDVNPLPEADEGQSSMAIIKGAGLMGALAGCLTVGFGGAVVCATGCMLAATKCERGSVIGDASRACGEFAVKANVMAREINEKHRVTERSKAAAAETCGVLVGKVNETIVHMSSQNRNDVVVESKGSE